MTRKYVAVGAICESRAHNGNLNVISPMLRTNNDTLAAESVRQFHKMIQRSDFPCVGAKSALAQGSLSIVQARNIQSAWNDLQIHRDLMVWSEKWRDDPEGLRSLVIIFEGPLDLDEAQFESAMWERLQSLADKDHWLGQRLDRKVSADPDDPHFSLSFGGEAYFAVGLHPTASRPARRFAQPAIVFNLHSQFERLREEGRFERMRERIMARDIELAGTPNPMLADHGTGSSARQYSGRAVGPEWSCPFRDPRV